MDCEIKLSDAIDDIEYIICINMEKGIWLLITGPVIPVFRLKKQTSKKELIRGKTRREFVSVAATTYNKSRTGLAFPTVHRNTAPPSDYYALLSHPLLTKDEPKRVPLPSLQDKKRVIVALIGCRPGISKIGVPGSVSHHPISPYSHTK